MPPHGARSSISDIGNKQKRAEVLTRQRSEKAKAAKAAKAKRKRAEAELGSAAPAKQVPSTLDSSRSLDDTVVAPGDEEVAADEAQDEFADIFSGSAAPKIMVTTGKRPSGKMFPLIGALLSMLPRAFYYRRRHFALAKISGWAAEKGFTHLIVLVEKAKETHTMLVCKLPLGPTCCFKFSSPLLGSAIPGHGNASEHAPEIILNNFTTRLGRRFGRLLGSLFPHQPQFEGRQVVTVHNQRDYIFFRRHRYIFKEDGSGVKMQELGPRFTLKPRWLLAGTFDPKHGDYEYMHKRGEMDVTRKHFHL
jgi:ribosome production factor 1